MKKKTKNKNNILNASLPCFGFRMYQLWVCTLIPVAASPPSPTVAPYAVPTCHFFHLAFPPMNQNLFRIGQEVGAASGPYANCLPVKLDHGITHVVALANALQTTDGSARSSRNFAAASGPHGDILTARARELDSVLPHHVASLAVVPHWSVLVSVGIQLVDFGR